MNKKQAVQTASHLISIAIPMVSNSNDGRKNYGFNYAVAERQYRTMDHFVTLREAQSARRECVADMVEDLLNGDAPEWATMEFKW